MNKVRPGLIFSVTLLLRWYSSSIHKWTLLLLGWPQFTGPLVSGLMRGDKMGLHEANRTNGRAEVAARVWIGVYVQGADKIR